MDVFFLSFSFFFKENTIYLCLGGVCVALSGQPRLQAAMPGLSRHSSVDSGKKKKDRK